jgi:hypothetical protein
VLFGATMIVVRDPERVAQQGNQVERLIHGHVLDGHAQLGRVVGELGVEEDVQPGQRSDALEDRLGVLIHDQIDRSLDGRGESKARARVDPKLLVPDLELRACLGDLGRSGRDQRVDAFELGSRHVVAGVQLLGAKELGSGEVVLAALHRAPSFLEVLERRVEAHLLDLELVFRVARVLGQRLLIEDESLLVVPGQLRLHTLIEGVASSCAPGEQDDHTRQSRGSGRPPDRCSSDSSR